MSKLRIFIEGQELDSIESVSVPITKQFEELSDPTVICNDYSKTVTVPLSKNNNNIFGHCYNPDRLIATTTDETIPSVGIYFDPYKKLDCRLQWGDDVFFTGYAKMLKVTNKGYEVTINGELGKIFQELQKITFDKAKYEDKDDINKYYIDGSKYVNTTINKELVYKCWNSEQDDYTLRETSDSNYDITDIIGFIPNNSYSNDFDYKTVERTTYVQSQANYEAKTFTDILGEKAFDGKSKTFDEATGFTADSVVGDGFYPIQVTEFRSYEQIPYIYWNKFWQIFQKKAEDLTGYKWDYSDSWFGSNNKNFCGLGITLLQRDEQSFSDDSKVDNGYQVYINNTEYALSYAQTSQTIDLDIEEVTTIDPSGYNTRFSILPNFNFICDVQRAAQAPTGHLGFTWHQISGYTDIYLFGGLIAHYYLTDTNGTTNFLNVGFCSNTGKDGSSIYQNAYYWFKERYNDLDAYYAIGSQSVTDTGNVSIVFNVKADSNVYGNITTKGSAAKLSIELEWVLYTNSSTFTIIGSYTPLMYTESTSSTYQTSYYTNGYYMTITPNYYKTNFRSFDEFTLNNICTLDFTNILDYCKRYRINIYVDEANKKLVFSKNMFNDYSIVDMTSKIDKSSTFDIEPIIFEKKYIKFGYAESDTLLGNQYKKLYNYSYGTKKITTNYNFSNEESTFFEKSKETILYSPNYLYWGYIYQDTPVLIFWVYNNNFIECRDSSGKTKSISGAYFYPVKKKIDTYYTYNITDDTPNMRTLNKYYYNFSFAGNTGKATQYMTSPELVLQVAGVNPYQYFTCLFEKPVKNYVAQQGYYDNASGIYSSFWESYINERYNVQNKKVTTYVRITPQDFINFKFNQFWKIGNQIYIVNKIYDYDITSDEPTKVDLITVQDITVYK